MSLTISPNVFVYYKIVFLFFYRSTLVGRDFLTLKDFSDTEVKDLLSTAADLKKKVLEENKVYIYIYIYIIKSMFLSKKAFWSCLWKSRVDSASYRGFNFITLLVFIARYLCQGYFDFYRQGSLILLSITKVTVFQKVARRIFKYLSKT